MEKTGNARDMNVLLNNIREKVCHSLRLGQRSINSSSRAFQMFAIARGL